MTTCVVKNPYILKAKSYISYYFFSLVSRLLQNLLLGVLLFFFIIYFYLIDITYDYNKLLLIWQILWLVICFYLFMHLIVIFLSIFKLLIIF